jgi:hypothetical protein
MSRVMCLSLSIEAAQWCSLLFHSYDVGHIRIFPSYTVLTALGSIVSARQELPLYPRGQPVDEKSFSVMPRPVFVSAIKIVKNNCLGSRL